MMHNTIESLPKPTTGLEARVIAVSEALTLMRLRGAAGWDMMYVYDAAVRGEPTNIMAQSIFYKEGLMNHPLAYAKIAPFITLSPLAKKRLLARHAVLAMPKAEGSAL